MNRCYLTVIFGPMFSGKTTFLLNYETRLLLAKQQVLIVKHTYDNRYSQNQVVTHSGIANKSLESRVIITDQLLKISPLVIEHADAILIDEGQFFPDLGEFCKTYVQAPNLRHIIVAGLSGDYKQQPFTSMLDIISNADKIVHLQSICTVCGSDAAFTCRLTSETDQTVVGGADKYEPRCRKCFV